MVPKIGRRRSDDPISKFRFCGENVGRSFVVCSHDPIFKTNKESSIWLQNDHRDIMQNLSVPFIFQEECLIKIEHVLFPSVFSKLGIRVSEGNFQCVHTIRFFGTNKNRIRKNGSCEPAFKHYIEECTEEVSKDVLQVIYKTVNSASKGNVNWMTTVVANPALKLT